MTQTCSSGQELSPLTMQIRSEFANANVVNFDRGLNVPLSVIWYVVSFRQLSRLLAIFTLKRRC